MTKNDILQKIYYFWFSEGILIWKLKSTCIQQMLDVVMHNYRKENNEMPINVIVKFKYYLHKIYTSNTTF